MIEAVVGLVTSWFNRKQAEQDAKAKLAEQRQRGSDNYDTEALKQMQFSWKDEYLMVVFTAPYLLAWIYPDKATTWITFVSEVPWEYHMLVVGMVASTFGLRWYFKRDQNKAVLNGKGK